MTQLLDLSDRLVDATRRPDDPDGARSDVVVFERNRPVAGGSFHAHRTAGSSGGVALLTDVWVEPGRRRRDRIRRALAALEATAATDGFVRLHVAVEPSRTDALALLRERRFTPVASPTSHDVELEKRLA